MRTGLQARDAAGVWRFGEEVFHITGPLWEFQLRRDFGERGKNELAL